MDKVDEPEADKKELIKVEFFIDQKIPVLGSKHYQHVDIFKNTFPEESIKCLVC
jgi:hypothetical protein